MGNNNSQQSGNSSEDVFVPLSPMELEEEAKKASEDFSDLLDSLQDIDPKVKTLWKKIFDNATTDRKNAFIVWSDLYSFVNGNEENHFKHGMTISKYMERAERANEQLLKLAVLVDKIKVQKEDDLLPSANDIFEKSEKKFRAKS